MNTRRADANRGNVAGSQSGLGLLLVLAAVAVGLLILAYALDGDDDQNLSVGASTTAARSPTSVGSTSGTTIPGQTTVPGPAGTTLPTSAIKVQVVNAAGVNGAAANISNTLKGPGYTVLDPATKTAATPIAARSTIYYREGFKEPAERVSKQLRPNPTPDTSIDVQPMPSPDPASSHDLSQANVVVFVGKDLAAK